MRRSFATGAAAFDDVRVTKNYAYVRPGLEHAPGGWSFGDRSIQQPHRHLRALNRRLTGLSRPSRKGRARSGSAAPSRRPYHPCPTAAVDHSRHHLAYLRLLRRPLGRKRTGRPHGERHLLERADGWWAMSAFTGTMLALALMAALQSCSLTRLA